MEFLSCLDAIKKRLWIIIIIPIVTSVAGALISIYAITPVYEGTTTLIVGRAFENDGDRVRYDDILMYQKLVKTYGELAKSRLIVDKTISELNYNIKYEDLQKNLKVIPRSDTQILEIKVLNKDAEVAFHIANTLADIFVETVKEMMNTDDVKIMDRAVLQYKPVKPNIILNTLITAFSGLMLSLGLIFLLEYLDNTIKGEADVHRYLGIALLANIPCIDKMEANKTITLKDPKSPASEAYRVLRTSIKFASFQKNVKSMVITSVGPKEGKSTIAVNLGITMAQSGSKVLILDGDLRNPSIHKFFCHSNDIGLTNVLVENASYMDCLVHTGVKNLDILLCGPIPPNPADLLGSAKMVSLITALRDSYDYVIVDAAPVVVVTDAALLASICDGTILNICSEKTIIEGAIKAREMLNNVNANILGAVLNKVKINNSKSLYGHYLYYYGRTDNNDVHF